MGLIKAGDLDRRICIERPVADEDFDGAGSGSWDRIAENIAASIHDALPSRGEKLADGINVAARPARVRIRYRPGITPDMRILIGRMVKADDATLSWQTDRIVQIVSGPAELGRREGCEMMVEEYSVAGNPA